ncbi:MAG: flagellar assembly protein T N-terminal domain-containing protein [Psychrobium sp.]
MKAIALLSCLLLTISTNVAAEWYDAKGRAPIVNGDEDIARNMAVQDAIKHTLLFTGAQVNSISQLSNGLLSSDRFEVRSSGSVRDLLLISEEIVDDTMIVHIRADIVASKTSCHASNTKKYVALTKFPLRNRQQAVVGGIFELGSEAAYQLFEQMSSFNGSYGVSQLLPINQVIAPNYQPFVTDQSNMSAPQLLAAQTDSQYLLSGEVKDVSIARPTSKWFGIANNNPLRQYIATYTLFDGLTGEKVWHKRYTTQAPWTFDKREKIDPATQEFWSNVYGESITNQLKQVTNDLNIFLQCQNLRGQVIKVNDGFVTVNLGKRHGLAVGDELMVHHATQFTDDRGVLRQSTQVNPTTLVIKTLYDNHLEAEAKDSPLYGDIQNDAIVSLKP